MHRLAISTIALTLLCTQIGLRVFAQQPAAKLEAVMLPPPDPAIQQMLSKLMKPETVGSFFSTIGDIVGAKQQGKLTDEAWLTQCVIFLSKVDRSGENDLLASLQADVRLLPVTRDYLRIDPLNSVKILAPYFDNPDPNISRAASEVVGGNQVWMPMVPPYDITGIGGFDIFYGYLRDCAPADPSWALVRSAYGLNADAALHTALKVYFFDKDRVAYERGESLRKELLALALSYDVANKQQKLELDQKLLVKLDELADYPHWSVRGYALEVIERGIDSALAGRAQWVRETAVPQRLKKDKNPFVSSFAKGLTERINETK